jgi:hypothetical protein
MRVKSVMRIILTVYAGAIATGNRVVHPVMCSRVARLILAASAAAAGAAPGWVQTLAVTGELDVTGVEPASSALLRAGPLAPSGVIQELYNPLGHAAGSEVFQERAGFTIDDSCARPAGFACAPGAVGVFGQPLSGGGVACGAFFNTSPRLPWRAAGALWFAEPSASSFGDDWFRDTPPFPGGQLVGAGGRLGMARPSGAGPPALEAGVTLGCSAGSLTPPGWLAEIDGRFSDGILEAEALLGWCSAGYRPPTGAAADTAWRASGRLRLSGTGSAAQLSATVDGGRPGFAPGRFIPGRGELSLQLDRVFTLGKAVETAIRLAADKRIVIDEQGRVSEESGCSGRLTLSLGRAVTSFAVSWSADEGAAAAARLELDPVGWMSVTVGTTWSDHGRACSLDVRCAIRAAEGRGP